MALSRTLRRIRARHEQRVAVAVAVETGDVVGLGLHYRIEVEGFGKDPRQIVQVMNGALSSVG